ncbi:hypothetical protein BC629DRAFT_397770 [Irpex lacteus]|nr:hypothetical protein BC629DRAFT_397770 [Irpex lacteus]
MLGGSGFLYLGIMWPTWTSVPRGGPTLLLDTYSAGPRQGTALIGLRTRCAVLRYHRLVAKRVGQDRTILRVLCRGRCLYCSLVQGPTFFIERAHTGDMVGLRV